MALLFVGKDKLEVAEAFEKVSLLLKRAANDRPYSKGIQSNKV